MSEPWIKRIRSIIAMVWVMLTWNWTWVIFPSDWHKMICTADSEWVTIHSSMHQPTVNSELCLPKDCTCKGRQNISEWTANLSYITVFTSLLCVFTYTMCRNMSVDAYQAAVALIAKDTLSLSNSKMMLIAVAGELNSRAGSPQQRSRWLLLWSSSSLRSQPALIDLVWA